MTTQTAVIGNGKSASGLASEIDACARVVRCGQWPNVFKKGQAGRKMDIWAWPGYAKMNRFIPKGRGYRMWITCPLQWHKGKQRAVNVKKVAKRIKSEVQWVPMDIYMPLRKALTAISGKDLPPSTGMVAIAYAVSTNPQGMFIAGFDAGIVGEYRYADGRPASNTLHPYKAEAELIRQLAAGTWLGRPIDFEVDWRHP